ncbi:MAG TPA: hypothetical protein VFQ44_02430 [Streptosporangiaceae bacterium]|nr:hypothetical protein [Streptosporangiaceae bacterium]
MNAVEVGELLGTCAAFDGRNEGDSVTLAWTKALGHLDYADCEQAVLDHYTAGGRWIMPSDVIAGVRAIQAQRIERARIQPPPPELTDDGTAYVQALRQATFRAASPQAAIEGGAR